MKGSWFERNYDRKMEPVERKMFGRIRASLIARAKGDVLEVGCGTGLNFPYYRNVDVTAIEPSEYFLGVATERAKMANVPIEVVDGTAEHLDFPDDTFDTIVGTLVFCTIPDPKKAVHELKRVCKPGGKLLLFEHVRHTNKLMGAVQDVFTPVWKRVCDGCHLNRDTVRLVEQEGFEINQVTQHSSGIFITIDAVNPTGKTIKFNQGEWSG